MSRHLARIIWLGVLAMVLIHTVRIADAALYWFQGVRSRNTSVCFVGDAITARPARVQQVLDYLQPFEYAANIHFDYLGTCPPPVTQPNGNDFYDGDIRVLLPSTSVNFTGPVPGQGCPMFDQQTPGGYNGGNDGFGSWSNAPNDLSTIRPCLYNLKLGDDADALGVPYLNHTLHEFGHALGLAHEQERNDVNAGCTEPGYGGGASTGFITPYDRYSVMHYKFASCGIDGNYGQSGLSVWDQLAVHIMYPEDARVAEYVGTTVIPAGGVLSLQSAWKWRGANMNFAAGNFVWKLNGVTYSTAPDLIMTLNTPGTYTLDFSHDDFLGRSYTYTGVVGVLTAQQFAAQTVTPSASASAALLMPSYAAYLPALQQ
ncbi:MAG TPA: hypothetical protein VFF59_09790 [Anaerolineae bacterium]|nr:hypothetical protein [Anaerolineae bacterium]